MKRGGEEGDDDDNDDGDVGGLFVFLFRVVFLKTGVPTLLTVRATIGRWTLNIYARNFYAISECVAHCYGA